MTTYLEIEKVINKPYLTAKDIQILVPVNIRYAREYINEIYYEMIQNGEFVFNSRERMVPTNKVLAKFGIDPAYIHEQARRMNNE